MQATGSTTPNLPITLQRLINENKDLKKRIIERPDSFKQLDNGNIELNGTVLFEIEGLNKQSLLIIHLLGDLKITRDIV